MTIKRVTIFGDSYADPHRDKERYVHETWYETLAKQYEYKNFAVAGAGPHYSMKEFYRRYKQFNEEDLVVWILSGEERIQFHLPDNYRKPKTRRKKKWQQGFDDKRHIIDLAHDVYWHFKKQEMFPHGDHPTVFFKTYKDHMSYAMKTFEREVINSNKKNESFLYTISRIHKCKICIFFLRYYDSYMETSLNDNLFYIHPMALEDISKNEYKNPGEPWYEDNKRNNHLSEPNHKIMYTIIDNFVQGIHEVPEFKQNLLDTPERKTAPFIYE